MSLKRAATLLQQTTAGVTWSIYRCECHRFGGNLSARSADLSHRVEILSLCACGDERAKRCGAMDYALFCAVALVLFAALQAWAWRGYRNKRLLWICTLLCLSVLAGGWFIVDAAGNRAQASLEDLLRGYASTYAAEMRVMGHADLRLDTPPDDPRYLQILNAEKRWLSANGRIADVYTFRRLAGGKIVFIADSETDYDHNGQIEGKREQRTPIGEVYEEATQVMKAAFDGVAAFDRQIVTDRWGSWVCAFEPILDRDGKVEAVLGVDFDSREFAKSIRAHRVTGMSYVAVLAGLISGASFIIGRLDGALRRTQAVEAELTQARDEILKSEKRFRSLVENAHEAISIWDVDGNVILSTAASERIHGYPFDPLKGHNVIDLLHDDDRSRIRAVLKTVTKDSGQRATTKFRIQHRDGRWRLCEGVFANLLHDPAVGGIVVNYQDVTEREWAQEALRRSEERYRNVFEGARDAFFTVSPDGVITSRNSTAAIITGLPDNDTLNIPFARFIAPEDLERTNEMFRRALMGERCEPFEVQVLGKHGPVHMEFSLTPQVEDGQVVGIFGVGRDSSQRRALEEQLRQSQKMDCLGQLAGGVAHDFNNLLTVVSANASMIPIEPAVTPSISEMAKEISEAAERAANLTRQLLTFSRHHLLQASDINLGTVTSELMKMLRRLIGENITLHFTASPDLPTIPGDSGMIEQVLVNLTINARNAMPQGGHLNISIEECSLPGDAAKRISGARPGHFVRLTVSDTGSGIAPEHLPRIFEPFFTTKGAGQGTGLGLATVYSIVKQHRGWIDVQSEPGHGAKFVIYLPASKAGKKAPVAAKSVAPPVVKGTETVLVVEDEDGLRNVVRMMLSRQGYRVIEASSGPEALKTWETYPDRIDILFTDVVMPGGMTGPQLATELRKRDPSLKVLFTSGYSPNSLIGKLRLEPGKNYLQKPYPPERLATTIREVLESTEMS